LVQDDAESSVKAKREIPIGELRMDLGEENSWTGRATVLRRGTEEKLTRCPTVAVNQVHQKGKPVDL
jgi:hypothetical protein